MSQPDFDGLRRKESAEFEIRLPTEPVEDYLRCIAYWREVEDFMLTNPTVHRVATDEAGDFLRSDDSARISRMASTVASQAITARDRGDESLAPRVFLPADPGVLNRIAGLIISRGHWIDENGVALGITPLDAGLRGLRQRVILTIIDQASQLALGRSLQDVRVNE